ncbi:CHAP domain-containing protein, partial [Frankia sp. Cr2]|uniref:CHAP domain-containing protein n=1 Tax=Frankia sp. Cr2 TaxID=3073932 RepID=UPI002AD49A2C
MFQIQKHPQFFGGNMNSKKRVGLAALAVVVTAGILTVGAAVFTTAANAANAVSATICSASDTDFSCDTTGYQGQAAWKQFVGPHNCTNYVAWRLSRNGVPEPDYLLGNAGAWDDNARAGGVRVDKTPAVGSVAQWDPGVDGASSSGHVAYVQEVGTDSIVIAEDNYVSGPLQIKRIDRGAGWHANFIHFGDLTAFPAENVRFTRNGTGAQYLSIRGAALPISYGDAVAFDAEGNRSVAVYSGALPAAVLPNNTVIRPVGRSA